MSTGKENASRKQLIAYFTIKMAFFPVWHALNRDASRSLMRKTLFHIFDYISILS